jgi:hypothetical protein
MSGAVYGCSVVRQAILSVRKQAKNRLKATAETIPNISFLA